MKKRGSMLIEALTAISIMMISISFIVKSYYNNAHAVKERILMQKVNEIVNNIECEFKYNMSEAEIEEVLANNKIGFKYDEQISSELCNSKIKDLARGNDIIVKKCNEDSIGTNFVIETNINVDNNILNFRKEFTKSWWMNE